MDLSYYVNELRTQLLVAAESGGEEARLLAERLVVPLQSATRLMLLEALSAAAGEITTDLAPGSVEVRLRGGDPISSSCRGRRRTGCPEASGLDTSGMATGAMATGESAADADEGATSTASRSGSRSSSRSGSRTRAARASR